MAIRQMWVDTTDLEDKLNVMRSKLSRDKFEQQLKWICLNTGRSVKKILKSDVPIEYVANGRFISSAVGAARMGGGGGGGISCVVPLKGKKATIGGKMIKAKGGVRGWAAVKYAGRPYPITAGILAGGSSTLPKYMPSYGGNAPFINKGSKLGKTVFTRKGKGRFPIVSVSALALPQMPMNLSKSEVEKDIHDELERQLDMRLNNLL